MSFDERTQNFLTWLTDQRVDFSPKIAIRDLRDQGQGRCVFATADIPEDEELFSIPRTAILNVDSCSLSKDRDVKTELTNMGQWEALILVFLYEWKVKGADSPWSAYFDVLPLNDPAYKSDQLIFWEPSELGMLSPSYIVDRVGQEAAAETCEKMAPLFEKYVGPVSLAEFLLVAAVILAYSFDVGNTEDSEDEDEDGDEIQAEKQNQSPDDHENENEHEPHRDSGSDSSDSESDTSDERASELVKNSVHLKSMVPLADTLNADTHKHNASLFVTGDRLVMRSIKPIAKDSQVYNIYAEHPNAEVLRRYGYVEQQGSAHDFAEVSLDTFKKYFAENSSLSKDTIDEILAILEEIEAEEDEKFVLDAYDCFASGDVIFELTFLTQLFVIIAAINHKKSFNSASSEVKSRAIRRVYKKSYQLLEARKLTAQFMKDFPNILKVRLSEYPRKAMKGFPPSKDTPLTRSEMAMAVLVSECISLQNCMDTEKVFKTGELHFTVIDDEKLLRNIMKKDTFEGSEPQPKKKKRLG